MGNSKNEFRGKRVNAPAHSNVNIMNQLTKHREAMSG